MLKKFIETKLLNGLGKFDCNKTKKSWYEKNGYLFEYNDILSFTDFLGDSYSFSARIYCILNDINKAPLCLECNNRINFKNSTLGFMIYCSSKCSSKSVIVNNKRKASNLEKYGVEFTTQDPLVKAKAAETLLRNYGVTSPIKSDEIRKKIENTNLEKYGNIVGFGSELIQEKILKTNTERYGTNVPNSNPEVLKFLSDKSWLENELLFKNTKTISSELGCSISFINYWAREHKIENRIKIYSEENEILDFIIDLGITNIENNIYGIIGNSSGLGRRQLDLYLPEKKLAIELNGIYWHSEDKVRHLEKLNLCNSVGIKLLQFWDYQWNEKPDICKSIIKSNLGLNDRIFARKCIIKELSSLEYKNFLEDNHLQGSVNSSKRYGLFYLGELVSGIGFSKSRYDKSYDWELIRYVNKLETNVVGGFSRLLKHFRKINSGSIISYCDLMVFSGDMYRKARFLYIKNSSAGFFYVKNNKIFSRDQLQKHKLKDILKDFDSTKTADQNLSFAGYYKVWNCGNGVWELI